MTPYVKLHKCMVEGCGSATTDLMELHKHYVSYHTVKELLEASVLMKSEFRIVE